jgi:hypothetical protein
MIETGDGAAAYYADIMQAVLTLAVTAPGGPPVNAAGFLDRLDARWLKNAWSDGRHPAEVARVQSAARHLPDIQLRFATLLDRLGPALDGPGTLADADAWYFILEGTGEPSVADAQAMAITELAAHAAINPGCEPRAILLAADDYSAVSRRVPLSNLYERGRSLGIGLQVSAQSWQGLGRDDDERYRIAATADGGIFVMHTPYPEPLIQLAGTRRVLETAHKLIGNTWQAIADQTHPGREDGGNLARYTQASAAYHELCSPWGRSEAYADLVEAAWAQGRYDDRPGDYPLGFDLDAGPEPRSPFGTGPGPVPLAEVLHAAAEIPARLRRGHPRRLAVRAAVIAGLCPWSPPSPDRP